MWHRPTDRPGVRLWLAKVAERQMIRPSFVPSPQIRQLRNVARYGADLVAILAEIATSVDLSSACLTRERWFWVPVHEA